MNNNDNYNSRSYNRKKQCFRIKLGIQRFIISPALNIFWVLPLISYLLLNQLKNYYLEVFSVAEIMRPIFEFSLTVATVIIPIALFILILQTVAEFTARKDESKAAMCFNKKQIENGTPILVSKKRGKNKNILVRTFYTYIPLHIWKEQQAYIDDIFNVRTIGIDYGKRANTIVLTTTKGRKSNIEDKIYDESI